MPNNPHHQQSSTRKTGGPFLKELNLVPFLLCYNCPQFLCSYAGIPTNPRMGKNGSGSVSGGGDGDDGGGGSLVVIRGFPSYEGKLVLGL